MTDLSDFDSTNDQLNDLKLSNSEIFEEIPFRNELNENNSNVINNFCKKKSFLIMLIS